MRTRLPLRPVVLILALLLAGSALAAGADKLVQRGDRYYGNRGKGRKWCEKAIGSYEKALAIDSKSVEASWRLARASYWLGVHTEKDEQKLAIFQKGIDVAKRAIALDGKSVACHFWLGVSFGKFGETKGVMNSLALVDPIKKQMARVLELDEKFEGGGAHRVLGRLYHKLPGIAGGSTEKAIDHLKKAIAIDGTRLLNHLFLAEVYVAEDRKDDARKHLEIILGAPVEKDREPENAEEKASARKLLAELDE